MPNLSKSILFYCLFVLIQGQNQSLHAQSIDQGIDQVKGSIKKIKNLKSLPKQLLQAGIKASGSVSNATSYYNAKTLENRRVPLESYFTGGINFDLFGKIKMPFTFSFNSQQVNFTHPFDKKFRFQQPFHRYQFKPEYKGFKALIGVNSMNFSPLTVSGHRFEGLGFIFKPSKFPVYGSFMSGVLLKAIAADTALRTPNNRPSYRRTGLGFQLGFKKKQNAFEITGFTAKDINSSLEKPLNVLGIYPQQNVVTSIKVQTIIKKIIEIKAEYAVSGLTENTNSDFEFLNPTNVNTFGGLLKTNASTIFRDAIKADINFKAKKFSLGSSYNRIDPDYRTLGAYFFTNDLENITANITSQAFDGKLNLTGNIGRQRDNLLNQKSQSMSQWVGSSTLAYTPSEFTNMNFNYSNFTSFTNLRTDLEYLTTISDYQFLDTLNFRQINQNLMANVMHVLGKPDSSAKSKTTLTADILYQKSDNKQGSTQDGSRVANLMVNFTNANKDNGRNIGGSLNMMRNDYLIFDEWLIGPALNLSIPLFKKKITSQANFTYLQTFGSKIETSNVFNANLSLSATVQKKHKIGLNSVMMYRNVKSISPINKDFWQYTAMLNYTYNFDLFKIAKK